MTTITLMALLLAGCAKPGEEVAAREPVLLAAGAPVAGVAEGPLDLPVGGPLGGFSNRCDYLGEYSQIGNRTSAYTEAWAVSLGAHTRQHGKALWLENGDQDLVVLKADLIYSNDLLVEALEEKLGAATGQDLNGSVVVTASHTHNGVANFSEAVHFYLGGDKLNPEVFARLVDSLAEIALDAYESRQPAALGLGVTRDWDPDDRVYRDRRGDNDALQVWDDLPAGRWKDPYLWLLRVDTADGQPLGMFVSFGIHGTLMEEYSPLISTDSLGGLEAALNEEFDTPVVVAHWQGAGGDASPAGGDRELARMETIGTRARDPIMALYDATPTSTDPLFIETVTRAISQDRDEIAVTRDGAVDWRYAPFDPDATPDEVVFDTDGSILSPLDEFNAAYGGAFCGDEPLVEAGKIGSDTYPYDGCMDVELVSWVVQGIFSLTDEEVAMPFASSKAANTSAARLGPVPIYDAVSGSTSTEDVYFGFFPAEVTAMYAEQFRRRSRDELGLERVLAVGYAQDHEGYFLIPEDWLTGGYETTIAIWGPLQAEHVMEGALEMMEDHLLTELAEPPDFLNQYQPLPSRGDPMPTAAPDVTAEAGTAASALPEDFYHPLPFSSRDEYDVTIDDAERPLVLTVAPDAEVPRAQGIAQFAWMGGDPAVDFPRVVLERQADGGGEWTPVTTRAGREVNSDMHDMLLVWQADPLYPHTDPQTHTWWVGWQAVGHVHDRLGVPEGTYRFHVTGMSAEGGAETWPWPASAYEVTSDPFVVTPAEVTVELDESETTLTAWIQAPEWGYRLLDDAEEGTSQHNPDAGMDGRNPARDPVLTWTLQDGSTAEETPDAVTITGGASVMTVRVPDGAASVTVTDAWGNRGTLDLDL